MTCNSQGKTHIWKIEEALEEDIKMWDALMLLALSTSPTWQDMSRTASGESTTGGKSSAVILDRRHAPRVVVSSAGAYPTVTLRATKHDNRSLSIASVYFPHAGDDQTTCEDARREVQEAMGGGGGTLMVSSSWPGT